MKRKNPDCTLLVNTVVTTKNFFFFFVGGGGRGDWGQIAHVHKCF